MGIVLHGALRVIREDDMGDRAILAALGPGDFFGETLACAGVKESPVSVLAVAASTVLRLKVHRILTMCESACAFHAALIRNLVGILAGKNIQLQGRMEILEKKTIRERVLAYLLSRQATPGDFFSTPFNRSSLADYLAVDRCALSRALGRLREERVLEFQGNIFRVMRSPNQGRAATVSPNSSARKTGPEP
jgi:CRP-like cAMP-binding protein